MRVLLIGGSGFIGQSVVERLKQRGHNVVIFHRGETGPADDPDVEYLTGNRLDIAEYARDIKKARIDVAIDFLPWNDRDTRKVIETLHERVERVVHLSSGDVYQAWGNFLNKTCGEPLPLNEDSPLRSELYPYKGTQPGMDDYDKVLAERAVFTATYQMGYAGVIIRLPMVYGPDDRQHRTWEFVKRMQDGRPAILLSCCRGAWLWHRGYVDNVAFGIVLAAERPTGVGQAYNIGSQRTYTVAGWAALIGRVMQWDGDIHLVPAPELPDYMQTGYTYTQHLLLDTEKIRRELGYYELVSEEEAIQRTIEWQIDNPPGDTAPDKFDYEAEDGVINRLFPVEEESYPTI